jgi:hypothetical protein
VRHNLNLEVKFKHFLTLAIALAVFGGLFVTNANAQVVPAKTEPTTWTITIDATTKPSAANPNPKLVYTVEREDPPPPAVGCIYDNPDARNLEVCPNDIVQWTAKTADAPLQKPKNEMFVFHEDAILLDKDGPRHVFHASDGGSDGATADPKVSSDVTQHEYHVAVIDELNHHIYLEDPKIMIGTGSKLGLENRITQDCKTLIRLSKGSEHEDEVISGCRQIVKEAQTIRTPPK